MPSHTQSEKAKNAKKRAGGRGNRAARTAGAIASGAAAGAAVGGVARGGSRTAEAFRRARARDPGSVIREGELVVREGGASRAATSAGRPGAAAQPRAAEALRRSRALDPGSVIREGEARGARGRATQAVTAQQAGAIQPPHNSPAMSSFKNIGGISGRK